jgi:hypothetical protein
MRYFKILLAVSIVFCSILLISSCNKEESNTSNVKTEIYNRDFSIERNIKKYVSTDYRHALVAKTISVWFKSSTVREAFDAHTRLKGNNVVLLSDFLYNKVLDDVTLANTYPTSIGTAASISLCDLVNEYLKDYPGLEISFIKESNHEYPDIINDGNFETVSVYSDVDTYPIYKDGNLIGTYLASDEPTSKTILKLQTSDIYDVINSYNITISASNPKYADLLNCVSLRNIINNMPFITSSTKSINGCIYTNPLGETKVLTLEDIYTLFNINCGFPDGFPNNSDPSIEVRNMCDRDILRNKNETIRDVRGINGKTIFRSCDTWCSYWDKNCVFQVDVFIPTKAATAGEYAVLGSIMKVFSLNEKRLRNGWNTEREIPITEWLYLEGKHGDEWQYTWTGRHRKRGTTSETTIALGFSGKVGFKIGSANVELGASSNITNKITRSNQDCPLGTDIARYCSPLQEQKHLGDIDFKLDEK